MNQQFFIDVLEQTIALIQTDKKVTFAQAMPLPRTKPVSILPCPRVIIPLSGKMPQQYTDGKSIIREDFVAGHCFYARANCWSNPYWDTVQTFVSVVYHNDYVRFLYIDHDGSPLPPEGPVESRKFYHTALPPSMAIGLLLGVMNYHGQAAESTRIFAFDALLLLLQESLLQLRHDQPKKHGKAHQLYQNIRDYMRENFHQDITRESVAKRYQLNSCYVSRLFMQNNDSFSNYLQTLRVNHAQQLLTASDITIKEIAYHTGFNSTGYFIRSYYAHYGMTPGLARELAQNQSKQSKAKETLR